MMDHNEDVHNLINEDSSRCEPKSPVPKRIIPMVNRIPRVKTAPAKLAEHIPDTARFLRKNQRQRTAPIINRIEYQCVLKELRPPIPKPVAKFTKRSSKNFIRDNMKRVENMEAKSPIPCVVVSCRGEKQDLSLLLEGKKLRESETFGHVPKYLSARKKAWEREERTLRMELEKARQDAGAYPGYRQIPDEERQRLLKGLKDRWSEVHKEFQVLPVLCDTVPKVKRKLRLEKQLGELEKDIELLEKNPYIYLENQLNSET